MAAGAGFSVASLYYSQPMLGLIAQDLGASERGVGLVPTLTQLGYALGILLLAPLGDRFDRRHLILLKSVLLSLALAGAALAGHLPGLLMASLLVGLMATLAQDIVPAAAVLAPDAHRGQIVGRVMTGLLLGILLSRVVSGVVAEAVASEVSAWTEGMLVFRRAPLREVVDEINRYRRGKVLLGESALARAPVSGRFRIDDPDAALEQLRLTMSLDLRRFPGGIAVLG